MKGKKLVAMMTAAASMTALLAGCGAESTVKEAPAAQTGSGVDAAAPAGSDADAAAGYQTTYGSKQFDDVTINVELFDRSNAPEGSTISENKWCDYVNEQMGKVGIHVNFVTVPRGDEVPKMQAMVAAGSAPDLTITYTYAYAEDYFNQGGTWDLSPFIDGEDQAKNLKEYLGQDVVDIGRNAGGNLYGIVAKRATTATSNIFIRKDWLDKLGLGLPTTTDELYDALDHFVHNNPDGVANPVGFGKQQWWNLRVDFSKLAGDEKEWITCEGNDALQDYYDPGMKDFYQFMNKMYNNGLMDPEYYTWTEDDFKSHIVDGSMGCFEYNVNGSVDVLRGKLLQTLQENVDGAEIVSLPALQNANDGQQYNEAYAKGGLIAFCPKTASEEVVEACMTYLDWQATREGGFVLYHGFEGEHYNFNENGVPVVINPDYNSTDKDWIRTDLFLVGNQGYFETVDDFNACSAAEYPGYEQLVLDNYGNALVGTSRNMSTYTSPSTPELLTDIDLARDQYQTALITCSEADFDKTFDEYMSVLEDDGMKTIIEERKAYYDSIY